MDNATRKVVPRQPLPRLLVVPLDDFYARCIKASGLIEKYKEEDFKHGNGRIVNADVPDRKTLNKLDDVEVLPKKHLVRLIEFFTDELRTFAPHQLKNYDLRRLAVRRKFRKRFSTTGEYSYWLGAVGSMQRNGLGLASRWYLRRRLVAETQYLRLLGKEVRSSRAEGKRRPSSLLERRFLTSYTQLSETDIDAVSNMINEAFATGEVSDINMTPGDWLAFTRLSLDFHYGLLAAAEQDCVGLSGKGHERAASQSFTERYFLLLRKRTGDSSWQALANRQSGSADEESKKKTLNRWRQRKASPAGNKLFKFLESCVEEGEAINWLLFHDACRACDQVLQSRIYDDDPSPDLAKQLETTNQKIQGLAELYASYVKAQQKRQEAS